jgi:pyruvate dehydrogenase E2 component (dihydrolipoamide acetyltransferase)
MFGIEEFGAIINSPQALILAVGAMRITPVVREGKIEIGKRMKLTLSCDHKVVDGAVGAVFLADLRSVLENPAPLGY